MGWRWRIGAGSSRLLRAADTAEGTDGDAWEEVLPFAVVPETFLIDEHARHLQLRIVHDGGRTQRLIVSESFGITGRLPELRALDLQLNAGQKRALRQFIDAIFERGEDIETRFLTEQLGWSFGSLNLGVRRSGSSSWTEVANGITLNYEAPSFYVPPRNLEWTIAYGESCCSWTSGAAGEEAIDGSTAEDARAAWQRVLAGALGNAPSVVAALGHAFGGVLDPALQGAGGAWLHLVARGGVSRHPALDVAAAAFGAPDRLCRGSVPPSSAEAVARALQTVPLFVHFGPGRSERALCSTMRALLSACGRESFGSPQGFVNAISSGSRSLLEPCRHDVALRERLLVVAVPARDAGLLRSLRNLAVRHYGFPVSVFHDAMVRRTLWSASEGGNPSDLRETWSRDVSKLAPPGMSEARRRRWAMVALGFDRLAAVVELPEALRQPERFRRRVMSCLEPCLVEDARAAGAHAAPGDALALMIANDWAENRSRYPSLPIAGEGGMPARPGFERSGDAQKAEVLFVHGAVIRSLCRAAGVRQREALGALRERQLVLTGEVGRLGNRVSVRGKKPRLYAFDLRQLRGLLAGSDQPAG